MSTEKFLEKCDKQGNIEKCYICGCNVETKYEGYIGNNLVWCDECHNKNSQ